MLSEVQSRKMQTMYFKLTRSTSPIAGRSILNTMKTSFKGLWKSIKLGGDIVELEVVTIKNSHQDESSDRILDTYLQLFRDPSKLPLPRRNKYTIRLTDRAQPPSNIPPNHYTSNHPTHLN